MWKGSVLEGASISFTSKGNSVGEKFYSYSTKGFTRIEGPWTDRDPDDTPVYIPRQYRNLTLRPSQQQIIDWNNDHTGDGFDDRTVHCIYDPIGCHGKSTISAYCELFSNGVDLPICNDAEKLIHSACNIFTAKQTRTPSPVFIDLPRSVPKNMLNGIYTACEVIKKGKTYDVRHKYKQWWIDSPLMIVITNRCPDCELLSRDRWKIWTYAQNEDKLIPYTPPNDGFQISKDIDEGIKDLA